MLYVRAKQLPHQWITMNSSCVARHVRVLHVLLRREDCLATRIQNVATRAELRWPWLNDVGVMSIGRLHHTESHE